MKKKILVVDDTRDIQMMMTRILTKQGHQVVTAGDGFEALNILSTFVPDVMFVDMIMPKISGDRLCQLVREIPHLKKCHIVIVSGAVDPSSYDYRKIGADACIAKGPETNLKNAVLASLSELDNIEKTGKKAPAPKKTVVSAYKEITQELVSKDCHMETILENITEGVMEVRKGRIRYANTHAASLFGADWNDLLGKSLAELFPEPFREQVAAVFKPADAPKEEEKDLNLNMNGKQLVLRAVPPARPEGPSIVLLKDVSDQKQIEQALNNAMTYTENIINSMADSLLVLTTELTIRFANQATSDLLGYSVHELFGMHIQEIFSEKTPYDSADIRQQLLSGTAIFPEMAYRTKQGEHIPVGFLATRLEESPGVENPYSGLVCIAHDMRETMSLQAQIQQAEKMAAVGVLSAGFAHEIKNPLAIIHQGLSALKFSLAGLHNQDVVFDMIDRIGKAADRANRVVSGLLTFSKQSPPAFTTQELRDVVEEAITLVEHQFNIQGIAIERRYLPQPIYITVDKVQIQQVLINLLINAVEAINGKGTIAIDNRLETDSKNGTLVHVIISDDGPGIPPEMIDKIFDPFFTSKTDTANTGLGLSVSKGIIENHGGSIMAHSDGQGGTRMRITLACTQDRSTVL